MLWVHRRRRITVRHGWVHHSIGRALHDEIGRGAILAIYSMGSYSHGTQSFGNHQASASRNRLRRCATRQFGDSCRMPRPLPERRTSRRWAARTTPMAAPRDWPKTTIRLGSTPGRSETSRAAWASQTVLARVTLPGFAVAAVIEAEHVPTLGRQPGDVREVAGDVPGVAVQVQHGALRLACRGKNQPCKRGPSLAAK